MNVKGVENAQEYTSKTTSKTLSKYFIDDDDNNNKIFYGKSKCFYY